MATGTWKLGGETGTGSLAVDAQAFHAGADLRIEWLDVDALVLGEHRLALRLGKDLLEISLLGQSFQILRDAAMEAFDDTVVRGIMLDDGHPIPVPPFEVKLDGGPDARVRVYQHGVAVLGVDQPFAQPFGEADSIVREEWALQVGPTRLTHAGRRFDELQRTVEAAHASSRNALAAKVTGYLADLGPIVARKVASLLRDGRAVSKSMLEEAAGGSFAKLVERAPLPERRARLGDLLSRATGDPWLGLKLPPSVAGGDEPSPILFFVVPLGEELAFEVASEADHATYRFGGEGCTPIALAGAMVATRFRREPVFHPQEEVSRGEWRMAMRRGASLPALRTWFRGRDAHTVPP